MMAAVRGWLSSVIYTALVIAVAEAMAPEGGMKKIVSMTGGLVLLLMLIQPLSELRPELWQPVFGEYTRAVEERREEMEKENAAELRRLIEQRLAAYISDKAKGMGLDCRVEVFCRAGEDGVPYPYRVGIGGTASEELRKWIKEELKIPEERQVVHGMEG